jgi:hypothetical protein
MMNNQHISQILTNLTKEAIVATEIIWFDTIGLEGLGNCKDRNQRCQG